jgi:hypothetical protein
LHLVELSLCGVECLLLRARLVVAVAADLRKGWGGKD